MCECSNSRHNYMTDSHIMTSGHTRTLF